MKKSTRVKNIIALTAMGTVMGIITLAWVAATYHFTSQAFGDGEVAIGYGIAIVCGFITGTAAALTWGVLSDAISEARYMKLDARHANRIKLETDEQGFVFEKIA